MNNLVQLNEAEIAAVAGGVVSYNVSHVYRYTVVRTSGPNHASAAMASAVGQNANVAQLESLAMTFLDGLQIHVESLPSLAIPSGW